MNTLEAARHFRRMPTPAEDRLWSALRRDRLAGFHFRRQQPVGTFIADFYCKAARLAVEVDGPVHETEAQRAHDQDRDAAFAAAGIRVLRVTNDDVLTNLRPILTRILHACINPTLNGEETVTQSTPPPRQRGRGRGRGPSPS